MDSLVSAVAARIVFIEGSDVRLVEADEPNIQKPTTLSAVPDLLAGAYGLHPVPKTPS